MKTNYLKSRHIGLTEQDQQQMLEVIGVKSVDSTFAVPQTEALALPLVLKRQREAHAEYKIYSRAILLT